MVSGSKDGVGQEAVKGERGHPLEVVKSKPVMSGDSVWLEEGVSEMQRRMDQLNRCLVGWWGDSEVPNPKLDFLRRWVKF